MNEHRNILKVSNISIDGDGRFYPFLSMNTEVGSYTFSFTITVDKLNAPLSIGIIAGKTIAKPMLKMDTKTKTFYSLINLDEVADIVLYASCMKDCKIKEVNIDYIRS